MSAINPDMGIGLPAALIPATAGVDNDTVAPESDYELGNGDESIRQLNSMLRGEISAAETYRNVLGRVANTDDADGLLHTLGDIQAEHARATQTLRDRIRELNGLPADSSGIWGVWAQAVQETLTLLGGGKGALRALLGGEEHGLKDYQNALPDLDSKTANLVESVLVPAQQRHIQKLTALLTA
jgi:hypothetical protein